MGFLSNRWSSVFPMIASSSLIWLACWILNPFGFPWMELGWVGLTLSAALWVATEVASLHDRSRLTPSQAAAIPPEVR